MTTFKNAYLSIFCILALAGSIQAAASQVIAPNSSRLFSTFESLAIKVEAPFSDLFKETPVLFGPANTIAGKVIAGGREIPVTIRRRGWTSLFSCRFPKLMFKFKKKDIEGTIFEGNGKVDVGTHCDAKMSDQEYFAAMRMNHREALIYEWMRILEIPGYASRPARVQYSDTSAGGGVGQVEADGFFLEHLSSLKKRSNAIEIRHKDDHRHKDAEGVDGISYAYTNFPDHPRIDREQMARIALFESLIGNGDWRLNEREIWNLKLLQLPSGVWFPVPLDFNFAILALGKTVDFGMGSVFWDELDKGSRIRMLDEFAARLPQLESSLVHLSSDEAGQKAFRETLSAQFIRMAGEKRRLESEL